MDKPRPATEPLADIIRVIARQYGWEDRLLEERAGTVIKELIPEEIRPHVTLLERTQDKARAAADRGVFYLKTDSAAARATLSYSLPDIIAMANARLKGEIVKAIRLL